MRSAKVRKMDRKAKHKAQAVAQTEKSRQRRLANKAKRAEIHAIDPNMKVKVIDQVTYNYLGTEITVENGVIRAVSKEFDQKLQDKIEVLTVKEVIEREGMATPVEVFEPDPEEHKKGRAIDDKIEKERLGVFNPLRWKKKLTL